MARGAAGSQLLRVKLSPPALRARWVQRPKLLERLEAGAKSTLVVVTAPPGSGKTSVLAEWYEARRAGGNRMGWVSLDDADNDWRRFVAYLVAAAQSADSAVGKNVEALLEAPGVLPVEPVLTSLLNDIAERPLDVTIVLDDYHAISEQAVHGALQFIVEHAPPNLHLLIASRAGLPLEIARLRVLGRIAELGAGDLRFQIEEVQAFLCRVMELDLGSDAVAMLESQTEGWIAGLQLAALSLARAPRASDVIVAVKGTHHHLLAYLGEEVLARQPDDVREFLIQTSILEHLTGPLCNAVTERTSGADTLQRLERQNLFIVRLDEEGKWYRYHALFREFLQAELERLGPDTRRRLHGRAAIWFEQEGRSIEAIEHAFQAADYDGAVRIVDEAAPKLELTGQASALRRILDALPEGVVDARPDIGVHVATCRLLTGDYARGAERLREVKRALGADTGGDTRRRDLAGRVASVSAMIARASGRWKRCLAESSRALELLPVEQPVHRCFALRSLAEAHLFQGNLDAAKHALEDFHRVRTTYPLPDFMVVLGAYTEGRVALSGGRLLEARRIFEGALASASRGSKGLTLLGIPIRVGLAQIAYHQDDLETAKRVIRDALDGVAHWIDARELAEAHLVDAHVRRAAHDEAGSVESLGRALEVARSGLMPWLVSQIEAHAAKFALWRGDLRSAEAWAETCTPVLADESGNLREAELLTLVRVLIAESDWDRAAAILHEVGNAAQAAGRNRAVIEVEMLDAILSDARGDRERAVPMLARALGRAALEGFVRIFADEGQATAPILKQLLKDRRRSADKGAPDKFISRVQQALVVVAPQRGGSAGVSAGLVEPLTARELEILALVASGASNDAISKRLHIALATVKRHLNGILAKLDVVNRTQAAARARELGLLSSSRDDGPPLR